MALRDADMLARPAPWRLQLLPIGSTLIASCLATLPIVATTPVLPPLGLLVALGWRLLRPELWPAWMALPLGLADDLIGGAPPGTAMATWTISFLTIDLIDMRPMWRDHWLDWWIAAGAILFCALGGWAASATRAAAPWPMIEPTLLAILLFPACVRLCAGIDRWRLAR